MLCVIYHISNSILLYISKLYVFRNVCGQVTRVVKLYFFYQIFNILIGKKITDITCFESLVDQKIIIWVYLYTYYKPTNKQSLY